jgi:hypothetical protein
VIESMACGPHTSIVVRQFHPTRIYVYYLTEPVVTLRCAAGFPNSKHVTNVDCSERRLITQLFRVRDRHGPTRYKSVPNSSCTRNVRRSATPASKVNTGFKGMRFLSQMKSKCAPDPADPEKCRNCIDSQISGFMHV